MFYVENLVMHQIHRATDPRLTGIDSKDYEIITEAMILMEYGKDVAYIAPSTVSSMRSSPTL
jgi:hypothetical protein